MLPIRVNLQQFNGSQLKELQQEDVKKTSINICTRAIFMFMRGEFKMALKLQMKALEIYPQNYESFLNSLLIRWNLN